MAVTTEYSPEFAAEFQTPHVADLVIQALKIEQWPFNFLQGAAAGDIGSTAKLRRIPGGLVYFFPMESRITWEAFGAARLLDIGHEAFTKLDLSSQAASLALFDDDIDVSAAGGAAMGSDYTQAVQANAGGFKKFESVDGVNIVATVAGGTIPAGTNLTGYLLIGRP